MKFATPVIVLLLLGALGCQSQPATGLAQVRLNVAAELKTGAEKELVERDEVYDRVATAVRPEDQFEQLDYSHLPDIIVWLKPAKPLPVILPPLTIAIDPSRASDDVNAASVGQTILFRNKSAKAISIYSVSDGNEFQLASIAPNATDQFRPRNEGLIEILSDPAKPPIALIYAAPSPWVARTSSGKTVTFNNLPPGEYQAVSWHPRLPGRSIGLNLSPNQTLNTKLVVGVNGLPQVK